MASWVTRILRASSRAEARRGGLLLRLGTSLGLLVVSLVVQPLAGGRARMPGIILVSLAYVLASAVVYWLDSRRQRDREGSLAVIVDTLALTAALWVVGGLWSPLVALYLPTIALTSLVVSPRRGAVAALAATGAYAAAQLVALSGLAIPPAAPEILTASSPLGHLTQLIATAFVLGIGYSLSASAARQLQAAGSARIASEERARRLYESSPSLFAELDARGRILFASPSHETVMGYPSSEFAGRPAAELAAKLEVHREIHDRDGDPEPLMSVRARDGQRLLFETTLARYATASGDPRLIVVSREVTARVREHESLRSSEQRFRTVAELSSDLIVEFDDALRVVWRTPSFERVTGFPPERFGDAMALDLVHPEDRETMRRALQATRTQDSAGPTLVRLQRGDGQQRWFEGHAKSLVAASGERHVLLIARDVTEARAEGERERVHSEQLAGEVSTRTADLEKANRKLRDLQSRLLQAERVGVAGQLAGRIAHAINTPLQVLIGTLQMRIEKIQPPDAADERLLHLSRRIANVVEGMLNLSRRGELSVKPVEPESLLRSVADELAQRFGDECHEIRVRVAPGTPTVMADEDLLRIALEAVVENAIEASPTTSEIRLEANEVARGLGVELRVLDRGSGIADEVRPHIFEPFFSTKRSGTGLGLAVAAGAVAGHGGRIRAEPRPEGGTCVRIEVPVHRPTAEPPDDAREA